MKKWIAVIALTALCLLAQDKSASKIAGSWTVNMETPHGPMEASMELKQDGSSISGSMQTEMFGVTPLSGTLDGNKLELTIDIESHQVKFKISGTVDESGISGTTEMGGAWKAARK